MKPIKVFYHLVDIDNWSVIADEQVDKLERSGLLDAADTAYFNLHYRESSFSELKKRLKPYKNIEWVFNNNLVEDYEHSTAVLYQDVAKQSTDFNALYMHLKGVTYVNTEREAATKNWRNILDYWNIEQWQLCNSLLENNDCVSCNLSNNLEFPPHFSGTTRWMTSSFIRRMPQLKLPSTVNYQLQLIDNVDFPCRAHMGYRFEVEFQIGAWANRLATKLHSVYQPPHNYNGYTDIIPESSYKINENYFN